MTPNIFLTSALLFGLFHGAPPQTFSKIYSEGGWVLTVESDTFTHQTTCQIVNRNGWKPDVTVAPKMLAFHFDPALDTYGAWYRADHGAPYAWRDQVAPLIHAGEIAQAEPLDNATGGIVLIPIAQLTGANTVEVRPTPKSTPETFQLKSLWKMIAAADGLGCAFQGAGGL